MLFNWVAISPTCSFIKGVDATGMQLPGEWLFLCHFFESYPLKFNLDTQNTFERRRNKNTHFRKKQC